MTKTIFCYDWMIIVTPDGAYCKKDENIIIPHHVNQTLKVFQEPRKQHNFCDIISNFVLTNVNEIKEVIVIDELTEQTFTYPINAEVLQVHNHEHIVIYSVLPAFTCDRYLISGSPIFANIDGDIKLISVVTKSGKGFYTVSGISHVSGHIAPVNSVKINYVKENEGVYGNMAADYKSVKKLALEKSVQELGTLFQLNIWILKHRTDITATDKDGIELFHLRFRCDYVNEEHSPKNSKSIEFTKRNERFMLN